MLRPLTKVLCHGAVYVAHPQAPHSFPHSCRTLRSEQTGGPFPNSLHDTPSVSYCADPGLVHWRPNSSHLESAIPGLDLGYQHSSNFYIDLEDVILDICRPELYRYIQLTHRDMDVPPEPTPSLRRTSDYLKQAATILLLRNRDGAFIPLFTRQLK